MPDQNRMREAVRIIAEAGVNHNGSLDLACALVDAAADAGADAVKFQTFTATELMTPSAPKAAYQKAVTDEGSQFEMIRALELSQADHAALMNHARDRGIQFLSTPFDAPSVDMLVDRLGLKELKVPSGEITNGPLLLHIARKHIPLIVSTGMSTLDEVSGALSVIAFGFVGEGEPTESKLAEALKSTQGQEALKAMVTLLHCTTEYPAPFDSVNLRAIETMADLFGLKVGYSDHTSGISVPIAAVALGATVIEKHLTLDRTLPGPDHQASLEPDTFRAMVEAVRDIEAALGDGQKMPAQAERRNLDVARRSLVAAKAIAAGETFNVDNLAVKRPGGGITPMRYWDVLGRVAQQDYSADDLITEEKGASL